MSNATLLSKYFRGQVGLGERLCCESQLFYIIYHDSVHHVIQFEGQNIHFSYFHGNKYRGQPIILVSK